MSALEEEGAGAGVLFFLLCEERAGLFAAWDLGEVKKASKSSAPSSLSGTFVGMTVPVSLCAVDQDGVEVAEDKD